MRVGSVSKMFTATIVLQLVEEGAVDLDAPLSAYLGELPLIGDATVRQALSHTSGIANYTNNPAFLSMMMGSAEPTELGVDEVLELASRIFGTTPDQFAYSNTGYFLLGALIESVEGRSLNQSLIARINEPLGLEITRYAVAEVPDPEGLAAPWSGLADFEGEPDIDYRRVHTGWSDGSLVSTAPELATFLRALLGGRLLSPELLQAMTTGPSGQALEGFGYGLGILAQPHAGGPWLGHNGGNAGFLSNAIIDPDSGDVLIALTNNDALPQGVSQRLARARAEALDS